MKATFYIEAKINEENLPLKPKLYASIEMHVILARFTSFSGLSFTSKLKPCSVALKEKQNQR